MPGRPPRITSVLRKRSCFRPALIPCPASFSDSLTLPAAILRPVAVPEEQPSRQGDEQSPDERQSVNANAAQEGQSNRPLTRQVQT